MSTADRVNSELFKARRKQRVRPKHGQNADMTCAANKPQYRQVRFEGEVPSNENTRIKSQATGCRWRRLHISNEENSDLTTRSMGSLGKTEFCFFDSFFPLQPSKELSVRCALLFLFYFSLRALRLRVPFDAPVCECFFAIQWPSCWCTSCRLQLQLRFRCEFHSFVCPQNDGGR